MAMKSAEKLTAAQKLVSQCDRCGTCLTVCPLFGSKDIESSAARGKNAILRALATGGLKPTSDVKAALDFCLLCQRCVANCPAKVQTDEAMILARQYLADNAGGASLKYRLVGGFMGSPLMVKLGAFGLSVMRKLKLNNLAPFGAAPDEYTRTHFMTAFAGPAALGQNKMPETVSVSSDSKVAYFKGCGMQILFPEAAKQSLEVLGRITKPVTRDNVCCGLPHLAHVKAAYVIGQAADLFEGLLKPYLPVTNAGTLKAAVEAAAASAQPGDTVLLSPACASFDQFSDYEARGAAFRDVVKALQS